MNLRMRRVDVSQSASAVEEAAAWHDVLSDERVDGERVDEEARAAFGRWVDSAPENRALYDRVAATKALLQRHAADPRILELRHETALRLQRSGERRRTLYRAVAASVVVAALGLTIFVQWPAIQSRVETAYYAFRDDTPRAAATPEGEYSTDVGERLAVGLEEGSQVTLNTRSRIQTAFTASERRVVLLGGQALFEVEKDPARPFIVETAGRRIIAVGTAFDVRVDGGEVKVTMLEGTVRVERAGAVEAASEVALEATSARVASAAAAPAATLTAGEQLIASDRRTDRIRIADAERVASWRRGQVIFDSTRLIDAIEELNRYSRNRILLADPALGERRVSGAFATGRQAAFVEALITYFPDVVVTRSSNNTITVSRRE